MVQVTYPGVYIQEVPSGVRTITPVATSIAAFIGYFKEGPLNQAVEINGMTDFDRVFGGRDRRSEAYYALYQFFLNGGSKAYVVRAGAGSDDDAPARADVTIRDSHDGGDNVMTMTALNEGVWGNNIRVRIDHNAAPPKTFDMLIIRHSSTDHDAEALITERYLNLTVDPTSGRYFESVINEESNLVRVIHDAFVEAKDPASYKAPAATGTLGDPISLGEADMQALHPNHKTFRIEVRRPSGPGEAAGTELVSETDFTAELDFDTGDPNKPPPKDRRQLRTYIQNAIRTAKSGNTPTHPSLANATVDLIHDPVSDEYRFLVRTNPTAETYSPEGYIVILKAPNSDGAEKLGFKTSEDPATGENVQQYELGVDDRDDANNVIVRRAQNGGAEKGSDGVMPDPTVPVMSGDRATALADGLKGENSDKKTGLNAFEDVDLFNILCIPVATKLPDNPVMTSVISEAIAYCEKRRAFMVIDIPQRINKVQEMVDWIEDHAGFRHRNTATYFPRLMISDPENGYRLRSVGAGGTMIGVYARTDATRGVWKAPGGLDAKLRGISKLDYKLTDPENGTLNPIAINCMRSFPIHGSVAWGARTLDGSDAAASEWKYIPIRRLALMLEESLFRGTKWVVFEPNDEPTWAKVRQNIRAFMMSLFRQGAFQGDSPDKAFYVKCDGETTTADDRNRGIVNIEVGFAPLKPAEFVVIKIQQIPDVE